MTITPLEDSVHVTCLKQWLKAAETEWGLFDKRLCFLLDNALFVKALVI